ncbi:MAG: fibronectin type III domain-containing protein [Candidatus Aminicenantes bacterium]|nr:fibronectin type III domain-containing protein [Candidatus Aminicenantes bacterium]
MRRPSRALFLLAASALAFAACGHKGAIMAPLTRVPKPVGALTAGQRGGRILLFWKAAGAYIDGRPLPATAQYEIWLLRNDRTEANLERYIAVEKLWDKAFKLAVLDVYGRPETAAPAAAPEKPGKLEPKTDFAWEWEMSADDWKAVRLVMAVRVVAGKRSASDLAHIGWWPRQMPAAPGKPRATAFADRIEVRWTAPTRNMDGTARPVIKGYNVFRREPDGAPVLLNTSPVAVSYFMDRDFEFGKPYVYSVRALTGPKAPYIQTDESEGLEFTAVDAFPPAPPKKPVSVAAVGLVTLIWEAGAGEAPAGFRVWRRMDDEADFKPLTPEPIVENTYTDKSVEGGHRYEYAVTAVDAAGNESGRSDALTEVIKGERP